MPMQQSLAISVF